MTLARRKFFEELSSTMNKNVRVVLRDGRVLTGKLLGYDPNTMSICLGDAKEKGGEPLYRAFVYGDTIAGIYLTERPFDLEGLAKELEKLFPNMVKLYEDAGVIVVMDKIRVNETGVVEGTGPAAERAQRIYERFVKERGLKTS